MSVHRGGDSRISGPSPVFYDTSSHHDPIPWSLDRHPARRRVRVNAATSRACCSNVLTARPCQEAFLGRSCPMSASTAIRAANRLRLRTDPVSHSALGNVQCHSVQEVVSSRRLTKNAL